MLHFQPVALDDADWLADWLASDIWPFHGQSCVEKDTVLQHFAEGYYHEPTAQTFWIQSEAREPVGLIRIFDLEDPTPMFDLRIKSAYRGQGLGRKALKWLTNHVFETMPHTIRIEGQTRQDNVAMQRVFLTCGYTQETRYRKAWPLEDGGTYLDSFGYGILRQEWLSGSSTHEHPYADQMTWHYRMDWGEDGLLRAAQRGDILVVVDVLSFSSAVITATQCGGFIYPCHPDSDVVALARRYQAEVAVKRQAITPEHPYSLSPLTFLPLKTGQRVILPSPNGAVCSLYGQGSPFLLIGALLNARAVANVLSTVRTDSVTIIACGERWPPTGTTLRPAIEDYLGAGAILSYLEGDKSPEARVCESAFRGCANALADLIWDCASGQELREKGFGDDVRYVAQLNARDVVPVLRGERFEGTYCNTPY